MAEGSAVVRSMMGTPARIGGMPSSPVTMAMPGMGLADGVVAYLVVIGAKLPARGDMTMSENR
jgi:hypothetical protein